MLRHRSLNPPPVLIAIFIALAFVAVAAIAAPQTDSHQPYTIQGVQVRTNIVLKDSVDGRSLDMGPNAFQEVAPCRMVSTLASDKLSAPFGGPAFLPNESRKYPVFGWFPVSDNPCLRLIDANAIALALRVRVYDPKNDGTIYLTPGNWPPFNGAAVLNFKAGESLVEEGPVMIRGNSFIIASQNAETDLTADLLGYFIRDPHGTGPKGDAGAQGERGLQGELGPQGEIGPAGLQGEIGPQGLQGLKGETGAIGPQGEIGPVGPKGETGAVGPQGEMGAVGPQGEIGPQGPQGLKGETGARGPIGETGAMGPQGLPGPTGPRGIQGEIGPPGPQGLRGPVGPEGPAGKTGETGAVGPPGPKGDPGLQGEIGPQGLIGPEGPAGPPGPAGAPGTPGEQGLPGPKGDKGDMGAIGPIGPPGPKGDKGDPGESGGGLVANSWKCIDEGKNTFVSATMVEGTSFIALTGKGTAHGDLVFSVSNIVPGVGFTVSRPDSGGTDCFYWAVFNRP